MEDVRGASLGQSDGASAFGVPPPFIRVGTSPWHDCPPGGHEREVWINTGEGGAIGSNSQATSALRYVLRLV